MKLLKLSAIAGPGINTHDGQELASGDAKTRYLNSDLIIEATKREDDSYTILEYNNPTSPSSKFYTLLEDADDILASANA